jgi:cell division septation protein DedD
MNSENRPIKKGEFLMIAVVVLLTFGLTVTGVVYLAKYLIGAPAPNKAAVVPKTDEEVVVRYSIEPDNNSSVIITDSEAAADDNKTSGFSTGGFRPIGIVPAPSILAPETVTPPAVTPPPALVTPAPPVTPPAVASTTPKTTGKYQLQLFALSNRETAEREAAKLKADYPDIYVVQAEVNDKTWYRVRCCRTDSKSEAERLRSEITAKYKEIKPDIVGN